MDNNVRSILPNMCKVFNNSPLTSTVANTLVEKLDAKEFRDLTEWLKHASMKTTRLESKAKRPW